jgi:hypothetical protein
MKFKKEQSDSFKVLLAIVLTIFFCFEIIRIIPAESLLEAAEMEKNISGIVQESKQIESTENTISIDSIKLEIANSFINKMYELQEIDNQIALVKSRTLTSPAQYEAKIREKCLIYGCNATQVIRVMYCESKANPKASNGINMGLFQQDYRFWAGRASKYGLAGADVLDPYAQIHVSAQMFSQGMSSHWTCK